MTASRPDRPRQHRARADRRHPDRCRPYRSWRVAAAGRALAGTVIATVAVILLTCTPARAHVLLAKAQPNGNGTTTLTFTFDHGCGDSPTTELTAWLPVGVTAVPTAATTQPTGWSGRATAKQVSWKGPGVKPGKEATFSVATRIIGTIGQTFRFPTVQRCDNGESYQWTDTRPGDEHPAPTMIATGSVLAARPALAPPANATQSRTGASLPHALSAIAVFTAAAAALAFILPRRKTPSAPG
jgi:uncharacterized protein YcnI